MAVNLSIDVCQLVTRNLFPRFSEQPQTKATPRPIIVCLDSPNIMDSKTIPKESNFKVVYPGLVESDFLPIKRNDSLNAS